MADLAGVRIGAAIDVIVHHQTSADASGKRHVEQRTVAVSGAVEALAERACVGVVIYYGNHAGNKSEQFRQKAGEIEIVPTGDVGGQGHALLNKVHRTAKSDTTAIEPMTRAQGFHDVRDSREHPI